MFVLTATLRRSGVRWRTVERELCVFVGTERRLGREEGCQHCCLSTHGVIGLLRRGWEWARWARISMGAESGQLGVSGGTGRGVACVYVCVLQRLQLKAA